MNSVKSLSETIIPTMTVNLLLHFLLDMPNGCNTVDALKELCTRDFCSIFTYLLSLPFSHWHREVTKTHLGERLRAMKVDDLKELGRQFIPKLTALEHVDGECVPVMGPLSDLDTAAWDTNDWFYQLLHARQMEGECSLLLHMPMELYVQARLRFARE